jgi:hypothetical protein
MGVCPNYLEQNHEPFISRTKRVGNGAQSSDFAAKKKDDYPLFNCQSRGLAYILHKNSNSSEETKGVWLINAQ